MLHLSHRKDFLVDFLAERLFADAADPFRETWILLPGKISRHWLMGALAMRQPSRALAGVHAISWREALIRIARMEGHLVPSDLELRLAITEILEQKDLPVSFTPLLEWIRGGSSRKEKLSRLLLSKMSEAGFYGLGSDKEWQQELFRRLCVDGPWRLPDQLLQNAHLPSSIAAVHCFCIDEMPDKAWEFLLRHEERVSIYQFSPCRMFWEDLCSDKERKRLGRKLDREAFEELEGYLKDTHPLLANWGKLGRQAIRRFDELEKTEEYEEPCNDSLLGCLQNDLLSLRTLSDHPPVPIASVDESLKLIAAGSCKLREVQILRDCLLSYFAKSKAAPADVLVLAPEIESYEPLIQLVFGDDLDFRIEPISQLSYNPFLQGLLLFFELAGGRWDADRVLELFENSAFSKKQGISPEDLELFRGWMVDARVRGGWERNAGNWIEGLRRILLGLVFLLPEEKGVQIRNLDWGQSDKLELFLSVLYRLRDQASFFSSEKQQTLDGWMEILHRSVKELFYFTESQAKPFFECFNSLAAASHHYPESRFSFSLLRDFLEDACKDASSAYMPNHWQAVQFASLLPGALKPAKAIFLLGMDSESFPRKKSPCSFDWESSIPQKSDQDRYLLLQALFAAKECFSISYCHLSEEDGKAVEPALAVQELLQTLDQYYPLQQGKTSEAIVQIHPSLPYDRSYFSPSGGSLRSFSKRDYQAASSKLKPLLFWPSAPPVERVRGEIFALKDLLECAKNPWKFFLKKRLGIYLREEPLFSKLRTEDFSLPKYVERNLLRASLCEPIEEVLKRQSFLLPPGVFGEAAKEDLEIKSKEWKRHFEAWGLQPAEVTSLQLNCGGELQDIVGSGLLLAGEKELQAMVRHWPAILTYLIETDQKRATLYFLEDGKSHSIVVADPHTALSRWIDYYYRAQESLSPLIKPWIEPFLQKEFEEWSQKARDVLDDKDHWLRWVADRADPLPLKKIWEQWALPLRETFTDLLGRK